MKNIYASILDFLEDGKALALATIIEASGSTPQIPGASALFSEEGLLTGTLGGGILEGDADRQAGDSIRTGLSSLYSFSMNADVDSEEGAICGGDVSVLIDAHPEAHKEALQAMENSLKTRLPGVLATFFARIPEGGVVVQRHWLPQIEGNETLGEIHRDFMTDLMKDALGANEPRLLDIRENPFGVPVEQSRLFLEPVFPLPHLIIAGAGHIGRALAHLGHLLDFEVTVIDDRPEYANRERFPEAEALVIGDIGEALSRMPLGMDSYVVIVTRGHRDDAKALRASIGSQAAYVGMIGSPRKNRLMRQKFLEQGWATAEEFDRVHAPIGLDIQSKTVQEIAVSIAAELVLVRRRLNSPVKREIWSGP